MPNKTENFKLNQWEPEDKFQRTDFNKDNARVEEALTAISASVPFVQIGSYVGSGGYGSASPRSITFEKKPALVLLMGTTRDSYGMFACVGGDGGTYSSLGYERSGTLIASWLSNTLSFYSTTNVGSQFNLNGKRYYYLGIGL